MEAAQKDYATRSECQQVARSERRRKHDAMLGTKSATATGQISVSGFLQKADVDYDTEDEMNDGGKIIEGQDDAKGMS